MPRKKDHGQTTKRVMSAIIIFLMVGSLFGVIFFGFAGNSGPGSVEYNEYEFFFRGDHYETTIEDKVAAFSYLPNQVQYIIVPGLVSQRLRNTVQFDVTTDINGTYIEEVALAQFQMGLTLSNFQLFMRAGLASENDYQQEVITCADATQFVPVIYFREANETAVYLDGDCIIADIGAPVDAIRVKDRIVYDILGIINP